MKSVDHGLTHKRHESQQENGTASLAKFAELSDGEHRRREKKKQENRRGRHGKQREGRHEALPTGSRIIQSFQKFSLVELCLVSKFILK